ncbi:hypothetical protein [Raoultella ornithinolytica]|uniref:hypothetical protein n=1 Tax=Raoultella ornithinolytica TaxID=54291 RepID=UPI0021AFB8FB|nr:hypothetical protein [Raoultella ornithinolytica]MCT4737222.1 hypothetical protein [Raoultella ornithinolytica]
MMIFNKKIITPTSGTIPDEGGMMVAAEGLPATGYDVVRPRLQVVATGTWMRKGMVAVAMAAGLRPSGVTTARTLRLLPPDLRGQLEALLSLAVWWSTPFTDGEGETDRDCVVLTELPPGFVAGTLQGLLGQTRAGEVTSRTLRVLPATVSPNQLRTVLQGGSLPRRSGSSQGGYLRPLPASALRALLRWLCNGETREPALPAGKPLLVAMNCLNATTPGSLLRWSWRRYVRTIQAHQERASRPRVRTGQRPTPATRARTRPVSGHAVAFGSLSPAETPAEKRITVVDACAWGRAGLVHALRAAPGVTHVQSMAEWPVTLAAATDAEEVIVLRLPSDVREASALLLYLGDPALSQVKAGRLVLLSPFTGRSLNRLLDGTGCPWPVRAVDSRLPVAHLVERVCMPLTALTPDGTVLFACDSPVRGRLTWRECLVLRQSLWAVPLAVQAEDRHRNYKTLYAQRVSGLLKLGVASPGALLQAQPLLAETGEPTRGTTT